MPLATLSDPELRRHEQRLTMVPADTFGFGAAEASTFEVFTKTPTHLVVPRFYGLDAFGPAERERTCKGEPLAVSASVFAGELTDEQRRVVGAVERRFGGEHAEHGEHGEGAVEPPFPRGGMLVLPCGFGKTVIALHVATRLVGRRCLVLVHKQGLLEQWCERAAQFAPGATIGVMRQDRLDADADILVAMIQTVARRDCAAQLRDRGLVIVDECHHLGAPVFGSAMAKLSCAWTLGLSATPDRKDGLTSLLFMTMGSIVCRIERPKETAHVTSLVFDEKATHHEVLSASGRPVYVAMVNRLAVDARRNAAIASHVARLQRAGRNVLVLSERIAQLQALAALLTAEGVAADSLGFYVGASTPAEREASSTRSVLLSTYHMAREGLDLKHLTALCLASPTSDLTQAVGRVQRSSGRERTGPPPLILDPCDTYSLFEHQARRRRKFFKAAGFTIQRWMASTQATTDNDGAGCELFE